MKNNYWHSCAPSSTVVLILVHGFLSDSTKCWTAASGTFWPDLIESDARIAPLSIFMGGYHTGTLANEYGVADCAEELFAAIGRPSEANPVTPLGHKTVVFLCHSLGGIVVRSMLERHAAAFSDKVIGLCLMASPSLGSKYSSVLSPLSRLFGLKAGRQLEFSSDFLTDLDDRFMAFLSSRTSGTTFGAEAIEHKSQIPFIGHFLPNTVEKYSAARYFPLRRRLPSTNHSTIVKPSSINEEGHSFFVDFLSRDLKLAGVQVISAVSSIPEPVVEGQDEFDALFSSYRPGVEKHYVQRALDETVSRSGTHRNIWLSGPPGVGKTCILKRLISKKDALHVEVCLSQCVGDVSRERLIQEIYECICGCFNVDFTADAGYQDLVRILKQDSGRALYVHIDEVASSAEGHRVADALIALLADLVTSCGQKDAASVRFFVSSLEFPDISGIQKREKIQEYFDFIDCQPWREDDVAKLVRLLDERLEVLDLSSPDYGRIVHGAQGSPRLIKNVFRTLKYMKMDGVSPDINQVLADARREMVV